MKNKETKTYKSISEVAEILNLVNPKNGNLSTHTLRFWEKKFNQIKPKILAGKRRYYDKNTIEILKKIKFLLKDKGMTIKGVKQLLNTNDILLIQSDAWGKAGKNTDTEFNNIKLLNGTFNRDISVGKTSSEVVNLSVNSTDSETLGSHELYSDTYIFSNSTSSHSVAKNELNNIFSDNADYIIKGSFDENLAKVNAGHDARELKRSFDRISDQTGVFASALTRAKISSISDIGNYTFTLEGKSSSASTVTVAIENTNNLTQLKDAINAVTGSTGISASLTGDLSGVNLLQQEGYNIIVGDVTGSGNMVIDAVKKHAEGNIAKSKANVQVFLNNPVGVATHMDSVETVVKELKVIADNKEIIETLKDI